MKALVTGFEPFGGEAVNPSQLAVQALPKKLGRMSVVTATLPTSFSASLRTLHRTLRQVDPDLVLCVGQAGGRTALSLERVAINCQDARIADNDGSQPIDRPVVPGGPAAHFSTLPIKAIVAALRQAGLPAEVSNSAGTFVCNSVFYGLMDLARERERPIRAGFLHIPFLPEQASRQGNVASMALSDIVRGIAVTLRIGAMAKSDLKVNEGRIL